MEHITLHIFSILIIGIFVFIAVYNSYYDKNILKTLLGSNIHMLILLIVLISTLYIVTNRDTYLPFLGITHLPTSVFKDYQQDKFDKKITINVKSKSKEIKPIKVVYWAASPSTEKKMNPKDAYGNYDNYGVSPIVNNQSTLYIKCPASYSVNHFGANKDLPKHVHYRIIYPNGLLSRVKTMKVEGC